MIFENLDYLGCWERFNSVQIGFSSKLPQKLRQTMQMCRKTESQTFGKLDFNTFVKN